MVFNNSQWVPVGWGIREENIVSFDKVRKNCCFMVTYYHKGDFTPVSNPFIINDNNMIVTFNPNRSELKKIILKRKYPEHFSKNRDVYLWRMKGGRFQLANKSDFSDAIDIHTIVEIETMGYEVVEISPALNKRFFRYISAPDCFVS